MADADRPALREQGRVAPRPDDHFRADSGNVSSVNAMRGN